MDFLSSNSSLMMEKTLSYLWAKQAAVADNVANAETPGYREKVVTFEDSLKGKLLRASRGTAPVKSMRDVLEVDTRLEAIPPADIIGIEWFAEAAYALYAAGVLEKDGDGCLHPFDTATWDDTAGLLEGMDRTAPT